MKKVLLYRVAPHNNGLVFAPEERARHIAAIHRAIETSKTWGEFKKALSDDERKSLFNIIEQSGESYPDDLSEFSGEMLPGWSDGDYPPWLQTEMPAYIPVNVLQRYGREVPTWVNGSYWSISPEHLDAICRELTELGWSPKGAQELPFH